MSPMALREYAVNATIATALKSKQFPKGLKEYTVNVTVTMKY